MKTAVFHCFSGTGNALHLTKSMSRCFTARGYRCSTIVVEDRLRRPDAFLIDPDNVRDAESVDLFVFPVYAFALPHIMRKYVKRVRCVCSGAKAAALCVAGTTGSNRRGAPRNRREAPRNRRDSYEGQALDEARRLLSRRGWDVVRTEVFDYPHSITSVMSAAPRERRDEIVEGLAGLIESTTEGIAALQREYRPISAFNKAWTRVIGWLFALFGRRFWGKLYAADERCDGCSICERRCPARAIRIIRGRPSWNFGCEGCERCVNVCPKSAIQFSLFKLFAAITLFSLPWPALWNAIAAALPLAPAIAHNAIYAAALVAIDFAGVWLVDRFAFLLGFIPGLRTVVGFGYTRFLRRYPGPGA